MEYYDAIFMHIDIDKIQPKGLSNAICHWSMLCRGPNSENSWNVLEYFDKILHTHYYLQELDTEIANAIYHQSRLCRGPYSENSRLCQGLNSKKAY